jgi:aminoglycoside phosphotransferase (APT) family kinase protein
MDVWAHQIAKLGAPAADQARRLVEEVDSAAAALNRIEGCAGHGSYSPAHVILTPGRTVVVDWDGYDVADPTRDVARFIVGLQRLALGRLGSIRALDAAAEVFEQTYSTVGRPDVVGRLPYYKAATCLQLAVYNVHHQGPQWRHKVAAMLGEGLRILEQQT